MFSPIKIILRIMPNYKNLKLIIKILNKLVILKLINWKHKKKE